MRKDDLTIDFTPIPVGEIVPSVKHPKCGGYKEWTDYGYEFDCSYNTTLECDECKYGVGRKDPAAKCNQLKD